MQCGASTNLTYLYTLPQRFIIEGWFKPEIQYTSGGKVFFGTALDSRVWIYYEAAVDKIGFYTKVGGIGNGIYTTTFTSDDELQKWVYVRCFFDNISKLKGFYCTVNGVVYADSQNTPGAGDFIPLNTISFMPNVSAESSYWIIHELDETLAVGQYKTYQADRQIIFDFNGTTLGRERIRIPRNSETTDMRGIKSFSLSKSVENPISGSAGANSADMTLYNIKGQFSDDQYDAFDPFQGYYNGTQKYLQNRVPVEIESKYVPTINVKNGMLLHYSFDDELSSTEDNSGYGNSGTVTNADFTIGKSGNALRLDASGEGMVSSIALPANLKDRTIETWFYCDTNPNGSSGGIFLSIGSSSGRQWFGRVSTTGIWTPNIYLGAGYDFSTAVGQICDSVWHHLCAAYDRDGAVSYYLDGAYVAESPSIAGASGVAWSNAALNIPYVYSAGVYQWGSGTVLLDEVKIYDRLLSPLEIAYHADNFKDWGSISESEPLFIGRTTPGAFNRSSPDKFYGEVAITAEDCVAELAESKASSSYAFEDYDISDPANEANSLFHSIARLATKKEIKNYALNSSFENATIGDSWSSTGLTVFERSSAYSVFGTYSMKCSADLDGGYFIQIITFQGDDKINVGDVFNFSAWVFSDVSNSIRLRIAELDASNNNLGDSFVDIGVANGEFNRCNVSRTIMSASCVRLYISGWVLIPNTWYVDGVMLTRGIDPIDYFLVNSNDGVSGTGSSDNAATYQYDTVSIDSEAVDVVHPYALIAKGDSVWDHLKDIGNASIASYVGATPDGVLTMRVRYNELNEENHGEVEDFGSVATSLEVQSANAIKIHGYSVSDGSKQLLYTAKTASGITLDSGGLPRHPIANGAPMYVNGATVFDAIYSEAGK